jgi:hypothetical protein
MISLAPPAERKFSTDAIKAFTLIENWLIRQTNKGRPPTMGGFAVNEVRDEVGLDVSHHTRISQSGGEILFSLTSFFIGLRVIRKLRQSLQAHDLI